MTTDHILTLSEIKEGLKDKKLSVVSDVTKLSYPTLKRLASGDPYNYTRETMITISKYIKGELN